MINLKKVGAALTLVLSAYAVLGLSPATISGSLVQPTFAKGSSHECTEELINGKTYTVAKATIKASPEKVWSVLADYDNAHKVFPQVKHCKLMHDSGSKKVVKHVLAPSGLPGTYEYIVEVKESFPHALEWHRISGAFKRVDGYWKLEPLDGGRTTLVTYASYVDGGFLIPQALVRRQCRLDMPGVMSTLKASAESSAVQIAGRPQHGHNQ